MSKKRFFFLLICAIIIFTFLPIQPVHSQTTVTLIPVADASVESTSPNTNFGHADTLSVYYGGENEFARALIRFNLAAAVPPEAVIDSAHLNLFLEYGEGPEGVSLTASCLAEDWDESEITWNNRPEAGEPVVSTVVDTASGYKSLDITHIVLAWHNVPHYGLELRGPEGETAYLLFFDGREGEIPPRAPQLVVSYHLPPAQPYTFAGHVYQGNPPETSTPIASVAVGLWGDEDEWPEAGFGRVLLTDTTTTPAGFFSLSWEPVDSPYTYFHIIEEDPPGTVSTGAQAEPPGYVKNFNVVSYLDIPPGTYEGSMFWDAPMATPTPTSTPTPTPTATPTPTPTSTPPPEGWCCYNNEVFPSSEHECSAMGGTFSSTYEEAEEYCTMGWCCHEGEVFPSSGHECSAMGGSFFSTEQEAEEYCQQEFPPAPGGWCCYNGQVSPIDEPSCSSWGGMFFSTEEEAEEYCQSVTPTPICPQPDAAGETFNTATSLTPSVETQEYICPSGDVDWWKLPIDVSQEINLYLYDLPTAPEADYDLFLFDPNGAQKASSEIFGASKGEYINHIAWVSGDWRVMVRGKGYGQWGAADWSKTHPYKLRADLEFSCDVPDEAGDTFADATSLLPSIPQASVYRSQWGYICPQGDIDFYKFETSGGQMETITVDLTDLPADFNLKLYDPDGNLMSWSNSPGKADEHIVLQFFDFPGAWRVEVCGADATTYHGWPYQLEVSVTGSADLTVQWIEVTQAIQDMSNSVPLVVGKPTWVRVYLDIGPVAGPVWGVEFDLYGWREDSWGTWEALPGSPLKLGPYLVSKPTGPVANQQRLEFGDIWAGFTRYPLPYSWQLPGSKIHLKAVVNPDKTIPETDFTNNTLSVSGSGFTKKAPINIGLVQVKAAGLVPNWTNNADLNAMLTFLRASFPVGKINVWYKKGGPLEADYDYTFPKDGGCGDGWDNLLEDLEDIYDGWVDRPANAFVFGLLDKVPPSGAGCGRMGGHVAASYVSKWSLATLAHEVGHNFGRQHAPCGVPDPDPNYPQYKNPDGSSLPGGSIGEVGVNVFQPQVYNPATCRDFMSYCGPEWVSPYTYTHLFSKIPNNPGNNMPYNPGNQAMSTNGAEEPHLVASGRVLDGQIDLPRPFWIDERPAGSHDEPGDGPYSLELQNAQGNVVFIRHFDPYADCSGPDHDCGYFRETLPFSQETMRIVFRHEGEIVHIVERSPNSPTVTVLTPNGGETWDGAGPYTVTWQAEDADGDPIVAKVWYSSDGGESWEPIAVNVSSDHYQIDASDLPGSDNALVMVQVSDGVNTTGDVSDASFHVADKAPLVFMLRPEEGERLLPGEPLIFSGLATDPEDGPMPDESLAWFSDVDGPLGMGTDVLVDTLSCGAHEITLSATDNSGMVGMATVHVYSALFEFVNLSVSPSVVGPDESVNITVEVNNISGFNGSCAVKLSIDGIEEATQDITLASGASDTATFMVSKDSAGVYAIEIGGLIGEFTVEAPFPWALVGGIIGGVLVILAATATVIYLRVFRKRKASA